MTLRRSVGFGRRVTGRRRETSWLEIEPASVSLNSSVLITHVMTAAELAKRPFTVVRIHAMLQIRTDNIANEVQLGGFGACVVSSQAVAIGVTAVPTPLTDLASDLWFMHKPLMSSLAFSTAVAFAKQSMVYEVDSKAMRKVNDDQEIIFVAEGSSLQSGFSLDIIGRVLIKES